MAEYTFRLRRGPASEWTTDNPVLSDGEPGVERDTGRMKIGNGADAWNDLPYLGGGVSTETDLDIHIDPAAVAERDAHPGRDLDDAEPRRLADRVKDRVRAGVARPPFVVDRPIQPAP